MTREDLKDKTARNGLVWEAYMLMQIVTRSQAMNLSLYLSIPSIKSDEQVNFEVKFAM
jgi:hypothetical protein